MRKTKKRIIIIIIIITCLLILTFLIHPYVLIRIQHKDISKKLDDALLSNNPSQEFEKLVPEINKYSSVKKAWFNDGCNFFVEYKRGGIINWGITPIFEEPNYENTNEEKNMLIQLENINKKLKKAFLNNNPQQALKELLPEINEYSSVEKAWFDETMFYVKFKKVSKANHWTIDTNLGF